MDQDKDDAADPKLDELLAKRLDDPVWLAARLHWLLLQAAERERA